LTKEKQAKKRSPLYKKLVMSWSTINEQHKATFHRDYVACHEPHERGWLVENVLDTFPQYRKSVVERAIQEVCIAMTTTPRKRKEFLEKLEHALEGHRLAVIQQKKKTIL
jgi:acyl-CoA reductase-like NAD-dependent aldehyde dehydrogenase